MIRYYLSTADIEQEYDRLSSRVDQLSDPLKAGVNPAKPGQQTYDYARLLKYGWEWVFEHMRASQPKVYRVIAESNPSLWVGERLWRDRLDPSRLHWAANAFLRLDEWYIVLHPDVVGATIEELRERHPCYPRFCALPRAVAEAYYARIDGLEVIQQLPVNPMESRVLPAKISGWASVENICRKGSKYTGLMKSVLERVADKKGSESKGDFRVFLDTREQDNYEIEGDALIVQEDSDSGRVFHVRNGDFGSIRIVEDPVCLLDDYVSHVLSAGDQSFDFMPYGRSAL